MGINIGDNNNIDESIISENATIDIKSTEKKKTFFDKHPIVVGFAISIVAGFILLFSFWQKIVDWVERLFAGG